MNSRDLSFSAAAAVITAICLYPTLSTTELTDKLPVPFIYILTGFPIVSIVGMFIASQMAKRIAVLWQAAKFGQVGVLNTAIDFAILNLLIGTTNVTAGFAILFINAISFSVALVNSYLWNKNWVFPGKGKSHFLTFVVVTLIGLSINSGTVYLLTTFVNPIFVDSQTLWVNVAKALATGLSMVWNFTGYRLVVFKKR